MDTLPAGERIAALETAVSGKGGIIDRLEHLDICLEDVKRTIWKATGVALCLYMIVQLVFIRH